MNLQAAASWRVADQIGQCRVLRLSTGGGDGPTLLAAHSACFDVDPYTEMFYYPDDRLHLSALRMDGTIAWRRTLGPGVVPGMWFCPLFAFDLDGDGCDEIYFVDNVQDQHPLALSGYRLGVLDARSGELVAHHPWRVRDGEQSLGRLFRFFVLGGHVRGQPVLVTAQGTYQLMTLQGWSSKIEPRWQIVIEPEAPGARGSHMCPIVDINDDGVDELLWGERCLSLDDGHELFCCDRDVYRGHSDVVLPVRDRRDGRWLIYTIRESDPQASPRVVVFDDHGRRVWGSVERGHMDMGWVARDRHDRLIATAIRIGRKTCGPEGRHHQDRETFAFDGRTGKPIDLAFDPYRTIPVDLNGDGFHELVRGAAGGDGQLLALDGQSLGSVGGPIALASHLGIAGLAGEQLISYHDDGRLRLWFDPDARDSPAALARYRHPFYAANARLSATGYNLINLAGV